MKGTDSSYGENAKFIEEHDNAKIAFDKEAALNVVNRCLNPDTMNQLEDLVYYLDEPPILVFPQPAFDDEDEIAGNVPLTDRPTNALPFAYAGILSEYLGAEVNETIIQASRVGTTRLPRWMRYLCQASFEGDVDQRRPYIVLDDVVSSGGTFATLRSYIIACTTALASNSGLHELFAIAEHTVSVLRSEYGQGLDRFWQESFGHGISRLTESEAGYLCLFARQFRAASGTEPLDGLRERINQAAATYR